MHKALKIFNADPNIDILVFFPLASQVDYSQKLAADLLAVKDEIGKPIVAIWTAGRHLEPGAWRTLHDAGIPLFVQTGRGLPRPGARPLLRRVPCRARLTPRPADFGPHPGQRRRTAPDTAARAELARFGVRIPRARARHLRRGAALTAAALRRARGDEDRLPRHRAQDRGWRRRPRHRRRRRGPRRLRPRSSRTRARIAPAARPSTASRSRR